MQRAGKITAIVLIIGVIALLFPFLKGDSETKTLDDAVRAAMTEKTFVKLSDGVTHYELAGPLEGPKVVFVHGLTSPSFIWDHQFQEMADAGFRVMRFDLFGRGLSDRPQVDYTADLFDRQLLNLLDDVGFNQPVTLVGLSMGGAITIHFTDRHPDRVKAFVLIAPGGVAEKLPFIANVVTLPGISTWLTKAFGDMVFERIMTSQFSKDPSHIDDIRRAYQEQMQYHGYKNAVISSIANNPLSGQQSVFERVGKLAKPAMLIWGDQDNVVPYALHEKVETSIPGIELLTVPDAGHTANYEYPEKVNPALLTFLRAHAS